MSAAFSPVGGEVRSDARGTLLPGLAAAQPHVKAGKMRLLAITGLRRDWLRPDVPTVDESGSKGLDGSIAE